MLVFPSLYKRERGFGLLGTQFQAVQEPEKNDIVLMKGMKKREIYFIVTYLRVS
jgi:hypothetical protein